jgi:Bacterial Ig-like domain (group 3)/Taurine catabolism dioxygenase TauD, TfdA family
MRQAWAEHGVIFFRGQHLTAPQREGFARQFGQIPHTFVKVLSKSGNLAPSPNINNVTGRFRTRPDGWKGLSMHGFIGAACRRTAGMAAGVVLAGGLAGGVLLAPTAAFASTAVGTTTAISGTTQMSTWHGTTLNVQVSVTPASGTVWPAGTVNVSDGRDGCSVTLAQQGSSAVGVGNCNINNLPAGTYTLTASYQGSSSFSTSASGPDTVRIGSTRHGRINIDTFLHCPSTVFTGQKGACTLFVRNSGRTPAPDVSAQIALPPQLRADFCDFFSFGCRISGNTVVEHLGTLNPGQSRELTVVFTAKTGHNLWGPHPGHRFTVKVVGSAESAFPSWWFFGQRVSFSTAHVTIIPRGFWW